MERRGVSKQKAEETLKAVCEMQVCEMQVCEMQVGLACHRSAGLQQERSDGWPGHGYIK